MRRKKGKIIKIFLVFFLIILSFILIGFGVYFNQLSKSNYIAGVVIDNISNKFKNYIDLNEKYNLGDDFSINGSIDFDLKSDYYLNDSKVSSDSLGTYNLIKNLSNMETNFGVVHDKSNKKAFFSLDETIQNESILSSRYLIENSTKYYFVSNILNSYVNDGGCNYFEIFTSDFTLKGNVDYLYDFIIASLKSNLKEEYFERYEVTESINGEDKEVYQISIKLTDDIIRNILKGILNDLKNDSKTKKIMSSIYSDFSKFKIKDNIQFLDKKESYTINIYTSKILYEPLKYKVDYLNEDFKWNVTYEGNHSKGSIYYVENDSVKYVIDAEFNKKIIDFKVSDSTANNLGDIKIEKDINNSNFNVSLTLGNSIYDIVYSSKYTNYKKNKSYTNEKNVSFKLIEKGVEKLSGMIKLSADFSNTVSITEEISDPVLVSSLSLENSQKFKNLKYTIKERLKND